MRSSRGQATIEYVGAILLVVAILIAAAIAVAAPGVPATVVAKLRLGLCIVADDVCTTSDAAARGLEPCVVAGEEHTTATGLSLWVFRAGGTDTWSAQRMSDGSVVLTDGYGQSVSGTAGVQLGAAKAGSADVDVGFATGRAWRMSEGRFAQLLTLTLGDPHRFRMLLEGLLGEPDETFKEGDGGADLALKAKALPGGAADARAVLGRRSGPDGTTYYADLGGHSGGALAGALPDLDLPGHLVAEYRTSDPPVLTLRGTTPRRGGEEIETVLRLPLRDASDRALAQRVAFLDLSDPALALRDLAGRVRDRGTVERSRYRVTEDADSWDYGIKLGLALGADHAASAVQRSLVDAQVLSGGALPAHRDDCVGP